MNDLDLALMEFWGSFEDRTRIPVVRLPAFAGHAFVRDAQGQAVPPPFPYITYQLTLPDFGGQQLMQASIWDRRLGMPGFRGLTNHIAEQVRERIPHAGVRLPVEGGFIWLQRANNNFIDYPAWPDPDDALIVRCMINLAVRSNIL